MQFKFLSSLSSTMILTTFNFINFKRLLRDTCSSFETSVYFQLLKLSLSLYFIFDKSELAPNYKLTYKYLHRTSGPFGSYFLPHDSSKQLLSTTSSPEFLPTKNERTKIDLQITKSCIPSAMFVWNVISQNALLVWLPGVAAKYTRRGYKLDALSISVNFTIISKKFEMMDRTALFKATVKTIRTRNKALGVKEATRDILGSKRQKSEFGTRAKDVVRCMRKLDRSGAIIKLKVNMAVIQSNIT